jgi:hypothetical protein
VIALLLALGTAVAGDELLVPTLQDLDVGLTRLERLLDEAGDAEARLAGAQLAWATERCGDGACTVRRAGDLVLAARLAGHEERTWLQGARAELRRVQRAAAFEAVAPLVDPPRARKLADAAAEVKRASRAWLVRSSWHATYVEPWAAVHPEALAVATCPVEQEAP